MFNFLSIESRGRIRSTISFILIFFTASLAFSQQKTVGDTIPAKKNAGDEIANIGYGTQKKREITTAIASIKSDEFNKGNINTPVQLIQGKVAGLDIIKPGGDPNGMYYLRLRGLSTISANTQPLVIIDGMSDASFDNVDPNDIESISVLKDGSASAIYGARGSSGVILVTTKRGRSGTVVIEYNVYATAEMVAKNEPAMNAKEWRALNAELGGLGTDFGENTDWFREIEQTAVSQVHNLSMSGGTDKTSYRASVNYRQGEGVEIKTGYTQLNGRINLTQKALNDKFTIDINLGATERESQYGFAEGFRYASIYNPTSPVKSSDPAYSKYDGYFQQIFFDYYNPVSILELDKNEGKNRILNLSLKGTYKILKGLSVDAFYSVRSNGTLGGQYYDKDDYWGGMYRNGLASRQEDNSSSKLFESTAHFNGDISSSVNLSVLGGYSYQDFTNEGFSVEGGGFLTDDFTFNNLSAALDFKNGKGTITSYKNSNKVIAFFGRVNLNINNKWFLTASARKEGSSRFGTNNKWGLFPALGAGVDITDLIKVSFIDNLKFRVNYGITGNQPSVSYLSLLRMVPQGVFYYNGNFTPGYSLGSKANADLKWEKKGESDAGFDFSLLKSRLSGSFDIYTSTTTDLLVQYLIPVQVYYDYYWAWLNLGKIKSRGLELTLNLNVFKKSDFSYNITLTPSCNLENTLVSLSGSYNGTELKYGTQDLGVIRSPGFSGPSLVRSEEGKPIGQLLAVVFKEIDANGNITFVDENKDGTIDQTDRRIVGNGLPKSLIGFDNVVTYKNWDLNVFFRGVFGHDLINSYRALYEVPYMIISYNLPKTAADMRNATTHLLNNSSGILSSYHVENASFVSLDNMSLGYNFSLPESSQFSKIRLYFAGNNLFYITRYKGVDPNPRYGDIEDNNNPLVPGVDRLNTWPRTRSITFGAKIVF
ncbi:MAG: SusC/RagA family TonB-linked outer membrane protein [Bacteroidia bacterium]|nr:SusC/RagA family TonB-linked outer membrane protein [Bacteroidia bacterium]